MNNIIKTQNNVNPRSHWPDFDHSMEFSYNYVNKKTHSEDWDVVKNRYNLIKNSSAQTSKIPKLIHQIWIGKTMPQMEQELTNQIKDKLDSSWNYKLWTEDSVRDLSFFKHKHLFDFTPNYGQKSDILRYAILKECGGIYLDTDFLMLGSFDEFLDLDFFCGISFDSKMEVFNGLMGSSPNNPIIDDLLNFDTPLRYNDGMSLMDSTGPFFLTRKFLQNINACQTAVALPNSFFYPYPNFSYSRPIGTDYKKYIKPETVCCHMWSSAWM